MEKIVLFYGGYTTIFVENFLARQNVGKRIFADAGRAGAAKTILQMQGTQDAVNAV